MKTKLLKPGLSASFEEVIEEAAAIIRRGGLVAMPTETVYGLAANGLSSEAVEKIFKAKGRPGDNPLILHIFGQQSLADFCLDIPESAYTLSSRFWPGPLTLVLKAKPHVPVAVTAGLDTVALRCPDNRLALALIRAAELPLAAPSANTSGKPSPTSAAHVLADLDGRIDAVLDGGDCRVGLESTIIDLSLPRPRLLRPGAISVKDIEGLIGELEPDNALLAPVDESDPPKAPGMKYRHYAPQAPLIIVEGSSENALKYIRQAADSRSAVLCFSEEKDLYSGIKTLAYGSAEDHEQLAHELFKALRSLDSPDISVIFARPPKGEGLAAAIRNRLLKAADFQVINVDDLGKEPGERTDI